MHDTTHILRRRRRAASGVVVFLILTLGACGPREVHPGSDRPVELRLLRVSGKEGEEFDDEQVGILLAETQRFAREWMGIQLTWIDLGETDVESFFRRNYPIVFPENRTADPYVLDIIEPNPVHNAKLAEALARGAEGISESELRERAAVVLAERELQPTASRQELLRVIAAFHLRTLSVLAQLLSPTNGEKPLLDPALPFHQYVYWSAAIERVRRFDLILTSQILASAETIDPSIHASLRGGVTPGFVERSNGIYGGTVVVSSYPFLGDELPLRQLRGGTSFGPEEAPRLAGAYATLELARLLLHAGFELDEERCLMNPPVALRFREWYERVETPPPGRNCVLEPGAPLREVFLGNRPWWERTKNTVLRVLDRLAGK